MTIPLDLKISVTGPDKISVPTPDKVLEAASAGVRAALDKHFLDRQREPRKDGLPMQGFWYGVNGNSVRERMRPTIFFQTRAVIEIDSRPLAHKLDPNPPPIVPKGHKYLTIPAAPQTTGRPAADFRLHLAWVKSDGSLPTSEERREFRRSGWRGVHPALLSDSGKVFYWLAKSARTPHDPRALPPMSKLASAAADAVKSIYPSQ